MADKIFPQSQLPIRKTEELLPNVFRTPANSKFMSAVVDPLVQPGVLQKTVGYVGQRYGKTYRGSDVYLDTDNTLRSRYQLEPGVVFKDENNKAQNFYDYLDFKNQIKFFGNEVDKDYLVTSQEHYSWNPPIDWDKFINFREYYWEPSGPPPLPVYGQSAKITSTYKVQLGSQSSWIFTPDGQTNNPQITLYRGQTYKFTVNAPNEGFVIRTNYDSGSLLYNPAIGYAANSVVLYDSQIWRAKVDIAPGDGSSINLDTQDWERLDVADGTSVFDYNNGVKNNGAQNGVVTFTVPYNAPDVLFYQSKVNPDRVGRFVINNITENTKVDVLKDVIGKPQYKSSNGIEFTNGLVVEFLGQVTPAKYATDSWLVEGVGTAITLTRFSDLIVPVLTTDVPEVLFDNEGFDTQPFDDATAYPSQLDYITISRTSQDSNPWSRYNRWFHRSVLEYAYQQRGKDYSAPEDARAKRPIIEFSPGLQLFNHGATAKVNVDYIDTYTDDVFSKIEGSAGYNVDGEFLFEGARLLVVADTDSLANNRIYVVKFIKFNNNTQITLVPADDAESYAGQGVLVRRGTLNAGLMYHFDGSKWIASQKKTKVNQSPLFDVFDDNETSFADSTAYPISSFAGCELLSYKVGNSVIDKQLGFSLSYLNIDNVGDIQFNWSFGSNTFDYTIDKRVQTKKVAVGYFKSNLASSYENGWIVTDQTYTQPLIDSVVVQQATNVITLNTIDWLKVTTEPTINFYLNGIKITDNPYTRDRGIFTFANGFAVNDVVSVKIITDLDPLMGYYRLPIGLERNPLNQTLTTFTYGQAVDHIMSAVEFDERFVGAVPGKSNLRDLDGYQNQARRFLTHSGLTPVAIALLCDKTNNIIKSLQYAKHAYTEYKNNFITKALEMEYTDNIPDFVDNILNELSKTKTVDTPFSDSDMLGSGAYSTIKYTVEDTGIKTFALSQPFDLTTLSRRAVYVYLNSEQLLNGSHYTFNPTFGFVILTVDLAEGDQVEIREYVSTSHSFVPSTPTALGLYKKYTPMMFVDDTYRTPTTVIQGHDGSITVAYGDYRDQLLLEFEYRIYNNIKQEYDENIFNIDKVLGGYYGNALFGKEEFDNIIEQEFLKWITNTTINFSNNTYFIEREPFTYTYSNMTDPLGSSNLPGWWRGVYQWFYDTDRPHRCPWEMLGFSQKPTWWDSQYGSAPYTSGNLLLWEDIRDGIVRQGDRAGTHARYARPTILQHIPVDIEGRLLSPLESGLANNFVLINNKGPFKLGDIAPVEYAWRSSSEYPFAVAIALSLLKPFEFISDSFDRSKIKLNKIGQTVHVDTDLPITIQDLVIPRPGQDQAAGLVVYLVAYAQSRGITIDLVESKIKSLDVNLSTRLSGFVDKGQQKYLLDSKNPKSTTSGIYIPAENYDIVFNVSSPISTIAYSGVILEKTDKGWYVTGYDNIHPYFSYYEAAASQSDPLISIGGISETFIDWVPNKEFANGQVARLNNSFYRSLKTHTDSTENDINDKTLWKKLPKLPLVGAVEAFKRRNFNYNQILKLSYGTELTSIQGVVDFLLGYEAFLQANGFIFTNYDPVNQVSQDWTTGCKEFMFWTRHNWAVGSLITISPASQKINIKTPIGVVDNLLDGFYDYQVLKSDGKPLQPQYINVNRQFQEVTVETTNTTEGIYYIRLYYVLKEHVTIFDDRTVFNDIIYDKPTGYRQQRIKSQGFRTTDWYGDYTSPGFLFDNVDIATWQPFTDYKLGDIIAYVQYYWVSQENQNGTETFDSTKWSKLDTVPEKQLVSNFDYKIKQFDDYFNVTSQGIGDAQRDLARHTIGYQTRDYLQNLAEDPVTQFQLYQGFIREKGTSNAIHKVFDKISRSADSAVVLKEEWAFRVGRYGGIDQLREIEFKIEKSQLPLNPQPFVAVNSIPVGTSDRYYRVTETDFTISPKPYDVNIHPLSFEAEPTQTAGYVKTSHVDFSLATKDSILALDIATVKNGAHIWLTFNTPSWTVWRMYESPTLKVVEATKSGATVTVTLNRRHNISVDDIVGFRAIPNLTGFFKVTAVTNFTIALAVSASAQTPVVDGSTVVNINLFTPARYSDYSSIEPERAALLKEGSQLWIDDNGSGIWEVIQKNKQYHVKEVSEFGLTTPLRAGTSIVYSSNTQETIAGLPDSGYVVSYIETVNGLLPKQIIAPASEFKTISIGSFGSAIAVSPDSKWLAVGAPMASGVKSNFKGIFDPAANYLVYDIVIYNDTLWQAVNAVYADGSTIDFNTQDWAPADNIEAYSTANGTGYYKQGMIALYERANQQWEYRASYVSPRPASSEYFGSSITIGVSGTSYFMAVSATGCFDNTGRVYTYTNSGNGWVIDAQLPSKLSINASIFADQSSMSHGVLSSSESLILSVTALSVDEKIQPGYVNAISKIRNDFLITNDEWDLILLNATPDQTTTINGTYISVGSQFVSATRSYNNTSYTRIVMNKTGALDSDKGNPVSLVINFKKEILKAGDQYGYSVAMNKAGDVLAVGAPFSDGQYFDNYRGLWKDTTEYFEGDVVQYNGSYYLLTLDTADSSYVNVGSTPTTLPWTAIGDSVANPSGKVFVYHRDKESKKYVLKQTIDAATLQSISDLSMTEVINTGDQFGFSLALDWAGTTLVVTSPLADINLQNQGSVYVLKAADAANVSFRLKQKLESFEDYPNEYFGQSVSISGNSEKIVVGAKNTPYHESVKFDSALGTTFDYGTTHFSKDYGYAGAVYVFENKADIYFLSEKLSADLTNNESFGYSVSCTESVVAVGSPDYYSSIVNQTTGAVRIFKKSETVNPWEVISQQQAVIDIEKLKSISLYDEVNNVKIQDIDIIDPAKLKILNEAEQELRFKTPYDPAVYSVGTTAQTVIPTQEWTTNQVGMLWWNISTAKWLYYEQADTPYRVGNWGSQAVGSSIDVYEWVESPLLPSEWAALADTNDGMANGISGQPLYPNDNVYSVKELFNPSTGLPTNTLYYYWVKNKTIVPVNKPGRRISASTVASYINNPSGSGLAFAAILSPDTMLFYNFLSVMSADYALMNIEYRKDDTPLNAIHNEYQLIIEGTPEGVPSPKLETKWIDSLVGYDAVGNRVPDPNLPAKQKYGVDFRPRQSMFVNRQEALKITIFNLNNFLSLQPFADFANFEYLLATDPIPSFNLNLYDVEVDTDIDLANVGTTRVAPAILKANLVKGEVDTIDIVSPGFGYKVPPPVVIDGDGTGATAVVTLDNQGRVKTVKVITRGRKYSVANATVRPFSVLVNSDTTANGFWGIYAFDSTKQTFFRSRSQAFDTTRYWSLVDWWAVNYVASILVPVRLYDETSRIVKEIQDVSYIDAITTEIGDLVRVKEFASGGWAVFVKIGEGNQNFSDNWEMVGREKGTIYLSDSLYDPITAGVGYDNTKSYDTGFYDLENSKELRNILRAVKDNVYTNGFGNQWSNLFFISMRYILSEQKYVDWMFKTSFVRATHNVGSFEQKLNYKNDNLASFQDYINEVKPYRTTIREYISRYDTVETVGSGTSDFDLPPTYSTVEGKITAVTTDNETIRSYPWKWWLDNHTYSITDIQISNIGSDYNAPPTVRIEGDGTGAVAKAYVSNGTVSGVEVLNGGSGYTTATVTLVGGNGNSTNIAKAVAILGDSKARTFNLKMKFDRINKEGLYSSFTQTDRFTAVGNNAVFFLTYAPTRDKTKINITKNGQVVYKDEYEITLFKSEINSFSLLQGKVTFYTAPAKGDLIVITYDKNDELLDAINRVEKYYLTDPTSTTAEGMTGKELDQLMTGLDFGGVQIQGTTFEVTGGWDALPWFTDSWDSVESSADIYYVADGSTISYTFETTPENGQIYNIYIKRVGTDKFIRIDDPQYTPNWDSSVATNPHAEMPTFVGDGSTRVVNIGDYLSTRDGDILIFRPVDSDGSVTINDPNIVDTKLSGGTLAAMSGAYSTATGMAAEEIVVEGGKFISPEHVPAPEENVPGQVLDSVSIKVFQKTPSGASPLHHRTIVSDGATVTHDIGIKIVEDTSLLVYVNKEKQTNKVDYIINQDNHSITFNSAKTVGAIIEIVALGIGGYDLLDYQEFIADGDTSLFLTNANFNITSSVFVTVNAEYQPVGFINSTGVVDAENRTLVQFGIKPNHGDVIAILVVGSTAGNILDGQGVVRVNQQVFVYEGSTRTYSLNQSSNTDVALINQVGGNLNTTNKESAAASMIVEVNGRALKGPDTVYFVYDGVTNQFSLGEDPFVSAGGILTSNISLYINNDLKNFIQDYVYDGSAKVITIVSALKKGDIIKIETNYISEYKVVDNSLVLLDTLGLNANDVITVTWFNEYASMKIVSDEYTGGKVQYQLAHSPISVSYVWVYKNGIRLAQDYDYYVDQDRAVVYLTTASTVNDAIKIVLFSNSIYRLPSAYEIYKDMLNIYHFTRHSRTADVVLAKDFNYYDTSLTVTDASELTEPIQSRNVPGVVLINEERIEYMQKAGNVLSQLRRGSRGSAIATLHPAGSYVVDVGSSEILPYNETQDRVDLISNGTPDDSTVGSAQTVGPFDFTPVKGTRSSWTRTTIPAEFGPCDSVEVFVGGRRLRKDPLQVYDEILGSEGAGVYKTLEAEFSVDGATPYIRLTTTVPAGTRITVIRKLGRVWYDRGENTITTGVSLLENNTAIAKFIAEKTTKIPE